MTDFTKLYQAIIFDCDGTLVDSMPTHFQAWQVITQKYGLVFPEDRFYQMGGVSTISILETLASEAGKSLDCEAIAKEKEIYFRQFLPTLQPISEVVDVARRFHGRLPLAVATGSKRSVAEAELAQIDALHLFTALACAEDVKKHKPAPDVFLEAARRIQVDPQRCLAYDDTDIGLKAARDAGMVTIDVRTLRR